MVLNERRRLAVMFHLNRATITETVAQCELGRSAISVPAVLRARRLETLNSIGQNPCAGGWATQHHIRDGPSNIKHKWAREVLLTILRARAFLIDDKRDGGDSSRLHAIGEVKLNKDKTVYEGNRS